MSTKKNPPLAAPASGKICPVCGRASYSRAGIHPQCSLEQADQKILARRRKRKDR
jgi:hypothetical protein